MFGIQQDGTYRVENIGYSTPTLTEGYVVATRPIKREADLPTTGELFGRWTAADGTVYWDAVEVVADLHAALSLASQRGELAIWDLAAGVEIPTTAAAIVDTTEEREHAMICQDCALTHTNAEPFDGEPGRAPSGNWVVYLDDADTVEPFHVPWRPCPSCGTTLAGAWFRAVER